MPRNVGPAVVGDWILYEPRRRIATRVLPRRNTLARNRPGHAARRQILASNVDLTLIVVGLDRAVNARQIERYLLCALESGARAVIALNKADLASCPGEAVSAMRQADPRHPLSLIHI